MSEHEQLEKIIANDEKKVVCEQKDLQITSLYEKNLLLAAEIENERKAHAKETEQVIKHANKKILLKILPLIENYKRALLFTEESKNKVVKNFVIGFEMILNDFRDNLKSEGVEEYFPRPYKEVWDSNLCEIVDEIENNEYESGTILKVVQSGYFLHKRLLSPAKVVVSKIK